MSISVALICRNSSDVIEKCLESVKDADEIIVVDTGSFDNTMDIAKKYTDKVYEYWGCNEGGKKDGLFASFADARNKALSYCTMTHILTIDADEWLTNVETGQHVLDGGRLRPKTSMDYLKEFTGDALSIQCMSWDSGEIHRQPRVYKNTPEIYWKGAAHNYLTISGGVKSDIMIYYAKNQQKKRDPDRTMRILRREVKKHGGAREMYYLAKEYHRRGWLKKAIRLFRRYVKKSTFPAEKCDAFIQLCRCYAALKDLRQAANCAMAAINVNPQTSEALRLAGDLSEDITRLKFKHLANHATDDGVLFVRFDNRLKITLFVVPEFNETAINIANEVRRITTNKIDIELISITPNKKVHCIDQYGWDIVQARINESSIVHFCTNVECGRNIHRLIIPEAVKIIHSVKSKEGITGDYVTDKILTGNEWIDVYMDLTKTEVDNEGMPKPKLNQN